MCGLEILVSRCRLAAERQADSRVNAGTISLCRHYGRGHSDSVRKFEMLLIELI